MSEPGDKRRYHQARGTGDANRLSRAGDLADFGSGESAPGQYQATRRAQVVNQYSVVSEESQDDPDHRQRMVAKPPEQHTTQQHEEKFCQGKRDGMFVDQPAQERIRLGCQAGSDPVEGKQRVQGIEHQHRSERQAQGSGALFGVGPRPADRCHAQSARHQIVRTSLGGKPGKGLCAFCGLQHPTNLQRNTRPPGASAATPMITPGATYGAVQTLRSRGSLFAPRAATRARGGMRFPLNRRASRAVRPMLGHAYERARTYALEAESSGRLVADNERAGAPRRRSRRTCRPRSASPPR